MSIHVEVPDPAALYLGAEDDVDLLKSFGEEALEARRHIDNTLSKASLDGKLFLGEQTMMSISPQVQYFENSHEEVWYEYQLGSTLLISPLEFQKEPFGFYSLERVEKIQSILDGMGIPSESEGDYLGVSLDLFPNEDNLLHVEFGFASQEDARDFIATSIRDAGSAYERNMWLARLVHNPEERNRNEKLTISLMDRKGLDEEGLLSNYIEDGDSFAKSVLTYANTYQCFLRALYEERGIPEPSVLVTFQLPS